MERMRKKNSGKMRTKRNGNFFDFEIFFPKIFFNIRYVGLKYFEREGELGIERRLKRDQWQNLSIETKKKYFLKNTILQIVSRIRASYICLWWFDLRLEPIYTCL